MKVKHDNNLPEDDWILSIIIIVEYDLSTSYDKIHTTCGKNDNDFSSALLHVYVTCVTICTIIQKEKNAFYLIHVYAWFALDNQIYNYRSSYKYV